MAEPRSEDRTRMPTWAMAMTKVRKTLTPVTSLAKAPARKSRKRILTSSEGWKVKPFSVSIRLAPLTDRPLSSTIPIRARPAAAQISQRCFNRSSCFRRTGKIRMKASPAHAITNCFWAFEKLILATITRPRLSIMHMLLKSMTWALA